MKTFLRILFFFLLVTQICIAQLEFHNKNHSQINKSYQVSDVLLKNLDSLKLDSIINDLYIRETIPGIASLIIKGNNVIWNKNYGYRNLALQLPVEDSTFFLMASISKTFVATAIMQLWENGLIDLDGNINNYMPAGFTVQNPYFPTSPIKVKMLLTHSSSLVDNWNIIEPLFSCGTYPITFRNFLINYFTPGGNYYSNANFINSRPGRISSYSNAASCLLALIVEEISGKSFDQYIRDSIFVPLSMFSSSWFLDGMDLNKIALPYPLNSTTPFCHQGMAYWPIGQLRTNKIELSNFVSAYLNFGMFNNNRILDSSTVCLMISDQLGFTNDIGATQGLIWYTYNTIMDIPNTWGHTGGWYGCSTDMAINLIEKWAVLFFINEASPPNYIRVEPTVNQLGHYANQYIVTESSDEKEIIQINEFSLANNYPNPFNPSTIIKYSIPKSSQVILKIFNTLGEEIETLVNEEKPVGTYEVNWNAAELPSGVYFYRLQAGDYFQTRKMILLK